MYHVGYHGNYYLTEMFNYNNKHIPLASKLIAQNLWLILEIINSLIPYEFAGHM